MSVSEDRRLVAGQGLGEGVQRDPAPRISEAERLARERGHAFAVGNVGLERLEVAEEHEAIFRRYVSGEIDLEELDALVDAAAQALINGQP